MIRLIASDIDGTLLTSDGQITEGTKEMILNLENKGIPFILTSARSPEGVRVIKRMLGNHAPIIAFCGGLILDDDGNEIYSKMIPLKRALELKAMLDKDFPAPDSNLHPILCNRNAPANKSNNADPGTIGESSGKKRSWDFRLKLDLLKIHLKQKAEFINFSSWEIRT